MPDHNPTPQPQPDAPTTPSLDSTTLRHALGRFATGVTLITCTAADGHRVGLTANSFQSLSLQPPLVMWALRCSSSNLPAFVAAPAFAVNVLAQDQVALSQHFASRSTDKFALGDWHTGQVGAPVLAGCTAVFECTVHSHQTVGDHVLFIGEVRHLAEADRAPLLFQGGQYRSVGPAL